MARGDCCHLRRFFGVRGNRFFAENVFARVKRAYAPLCMMAVGEGIVNGVDVRIGDQVGVGIVDMWDLVASSKGACFLWVAGGNGSDGDTRQLACG